MERSYSPEIVQGQGGDSHVLITTDLLVIVFIVRRRFVPKTAVFGIITRRSSLATTEMAYSVRPIFVNSNSNKNKPPKRDNSLMHQDTI